MESCVCVGCISDTFMIAIWTRCTYRARFVVYCSPFPSSWPNLPWVDEILESRSSWRSLAPLRSLAAAGRFWFPCAHAHAHHGPSSLVGRLQYPPSCCKIPRDLSLHCPAPAPAPTSTHRWDQPSCSSSSRRVRLPQKAAVSQSVKSE
jgi:hypothetical protein